MATPEDVRAEIDGVRGKITVVESTIVLYQGQIASLQTTISEHNNSDPPSQQLAALQQQLATLQQQLPALQQQNAAYQQQIAALQQQLAALFEKDNLLLKQEAAATAQRVAAEAATIAAPAAREQQPEPAGTSRRRPREEDDPQPVDWMACLEALAGHGGLNDDQVSDARLLLCDKSQYQKLLTGNRMRDILTMQKLLKQAAYPAGAKQDCDKEIAECLFAPIEDARRELDQAALINMLRTLPAAKAIAPYTHDSEQYPDLFVHDPVRSTRVMYTALHQAMSAVPLQPAQNRDPGEAAWYGYWDIITTPLLGAALLAGVEIQTNRDVQDDSITEQGKRRDKLWYLRNIVLISAEDKKVQGTIALEELQEKHKGASPALYGHLGYTLHYCTGGTTIQFFAAPVSKEKMMIPISDQYNTTNPSGRLSVVLAFINIIRWTNTVKEKNWLPDSSPLALLHEEFRRPDGPASSYINVVMSIHGHHVNKSFIMLSERFRQLLPLYKHLLWPLEGSRFALAIRPSSIRVEGQEVKRDNVAQIEQQLEPMQPLALRFRLQVDLKLHPVGCVRVRYPLSQLYNMVQTLLILLNELHSKGYCHRDIREPNIIQVQAGQYRLGDWELAAPSGTLVDWVNDSLPPDVSAPGGAEYWPKHDLWQVGNLIKRQLLVANQNCTQALNFAESLQDGVFETADAARLALSPQPWHA